MAGEGECGFFVVGAYVECGLSELCRFETNLVPSCSVDDAHEDADQFSDPVGATEPHDIGRPGRGAVPLVGGAQTERLVDGWVQRRIVSWWQRARQRLVGLVGDRFVEVDEHGNVGTSKQRECGVEHAVLEGWVAWAAERPAEREIAVQHARWAGTFGLSAHEADPDGRQTGCFQGVGERTHGTRA